MASRVETPGAGFLCACFETEQVAKVIAELRELLATFLITIPSSCVIVSCSSNKTWFFHGKIDE